MSPSTIFSPSKPCAIVSCVVGVEVDMQTDNSVVSKLKHVAESPPGSFTASPFGKINFSAFVQQVEYIGPSLIGPYEIFTGNGYFILIAQSHIGFFIGSTLH